MLFYLPFLAQLMMTKAALNRSPLFFAQCHDFPDWREFPGLDFALLGHETSLPLYYTTAESVLHGPLEEADGFDAG